MAGALALKQGCCRGRRRNCGRGCVWCKEDAAHAAAGAAHVGTVCVPYGTVWELVRCGPHSGPRALSLSAWPRRGRRAAAAGDAHAAATVGCRDAAAGRPVLAVQPLVGGGPGGGAILA